MQGVATRGQTGSAYSVAAVIGGVAAIVTSLVAPVPHSSLLGAAVIMATLALALGQMPQSDRTLLARQSLCITLPIVGLAAFGMAFVGAALFGAAIG